MPPNLTAPGVYIQEIPSGSRSIVGISTSVTAFVGRTRRGPPDSAVPIANFGDFERRFGGLWSLGDLGHVVRHFFLNGGRDAIVVRVHAGATPATGRAPESLLLQATDAARELPEFHRLRVVVVHGTDEDDYTLTISAIDSAGDVIEDEETPPAPFSVDVPLSLGDDAAAAVAGAVTATTPPVTLATLVRAAPASRPPETTGPDHAVSDDDGLVRLEMDNVFGFEAADPGAWGNDIEVTVSPGSGGTFTLTAVLRDASGNEAESEIFHNLVATPGSATFVTDVLAQRSRLVRVASLPDPLPATEVTAALAGGGDGSEPVIAAYQGSEANRQGLHALDEIDVVNLLCVPFPRVTTDVSESDRAGFWSAALAWCRDRGTFAIIDPPPSWSSFDAVATSLADAAGWIGNLRSPHGAQYFPEIVAADPLRENRLRAFPPCGAVAGVIARTDGSRGVWKAPAGTEATVAGALDVAVALTDPEQGVLNREGVNCARAWPGSGRVLWGARTLVGEDRRASEWKYLPVRRLATHLQQTLLRGTRWAVFEGNDEALWSQLRLSIGGFMHQLFRQGAFAGRSPAEAYYVRCDADTTTPADIDAGIVNVEIGFAPVKPAEFVVIMIQQIAAAER